MTDAAPPDAPRPERLEHRLRQAALIAALAVLGGLLLGLLAWGAEAWGFYWLLEWLDVGLDPLLAMGIYAASMVAGALSFCPAGWGARKSPWWPCCWPAARFWVRRCWRPSSAAR